MAACRQAGQGSPGGVDGEGLIGHLSDMASRSVLTPVESVDDPHDHDPQPLASSEATEERLPTETVLRAAVEVALERVTGPLVLAISGGRDSMALMFAVARWAPDRLAAIATFDHGTGGYATEAASLVATEARRLGLTVVRERARTPAFGEAAWRDARWRFLRRVAGAYGARVATAHTRDDQLETIVMRLLRGAGTRGLAALAASSPIVRPWLAVSRSEVAHWASAEGVPHLDDPMNASRRFLRGRVRHELLPALEQAHRDFGSTMLALGERAAEWRRSVDAYVDQLPTVHVRRGVARVPASAFDDTTAEGRAVLWAAAFARVGVAIDARGTRELVRFSNSRRRGARAELAGGAMAIRSGSGSVEFYELRGVAGTPKSASSDWRGRAEQIPSRLGGWRWRRVMWLTSAEATRTAREDPWLVEMPADIELTIRTWQAGDRIITAGAPAGRRVTRYFSDAHIPALDRSGWPVVLAEKALLCVPGICRGLAAPLRPGRPASIWYRCERESD